MMHHFVLPNITPLTPPTSSPFTVDIPSLHYLFSWIWVLTQFVPTCLVKNWAVPCWFSMKSWMEFLYQFHESIEYLATVLFHDNFVKKKSFSFVIILSLRKRYYEKTALIICKYNYACLIVLFEENDILPVKLRRLWFLLQQIKIDWNNKIIIFNSIIFWQTNLKYPERYIFITP